MNKEIFIELVMAYKELIVVVLMVFLVGNMALCLHITGSDKRPHEIRDIVRLIENGTLFVFFCHFDILLFIFFETTFGVFIEIETRRYILGTTISLFLFGLVTGNVIEYIFLANEKES